MKHADLTHPHPSLPLEGEGTVFPFKGACMPFMNWNESLNLGIELIDGHHRHLVELVNTAHEGMTNGCGLAEMSALLDELVDYATYHFAAEEFWMTHYNYPRLLEHTKEHEEFCIKVVEQELFFDAGQTDVLAELVPFLSEWLVEHIQKSDGAYGEFARSIGATHAYDHLSLPDGH
jgi:hemerythrin